MYARMVIGEAVSDDQLRQFSSIYKEEIEPELKKEPGFVSTEFLLEDGGNMAVIVTAWESRERCLQYHSSRSYRQFVAKTQHFLLGNFVVKLFRME